MIVVALCVLAFLMLFFGFEMLLTMGLPAVLAKLAFYPHMPDLVIAQKIMGGVNVSTLLAIPFFVFAADLMAHGVIAEKLTDTVRRLMGHYPGGGGGAPVAARCAGALAVAFVRGMAYMARVRAAPWRCAPRPAAPPTWGE